MDQRDIRTIGLSARAVSVLSECCVETVDDMLNVSLAFVRTVPSCSTKTYREIEKKIESLGGRIGKESDAYGEAALAFMREHSADELDVKPRTRKILSHLGVESVADLVEIDPGRILKCSGSGITVLRDAETALFKWKRGNSKLLDSLKDDVWDKGGKEEELTKIIVYFIKIQQLGMADLRKDLEEKGLWDDLGELLQDGVSPVLDTVVSLPCVCYFLSRGFVSFFPEGIAREKDAVEAFRTALGDDAPRVVSLMERYRVLLRASDDILYIARESLSDVVGRLETTPVSKENILLLWRLRGSSLEECSGASGLSRQSVRVTTRKTASSYLLYEDFYGPLFSRYRFSKRDFLLLFPSADERVISYLDIKYGHGKEALDDNTVRTYDGFFLPEVRLFLKKKKTQSFTDGLTRNVLFSFLLRESGRSFDGGSFREWYERERERRGFTGPGLSLSGLSDYRISSIMRSLPGVAFSEDNTFRFSRADMAKVWRTLDFSRHDRSVVSSELLYRENRDAMEKEDIRDGYELYNLMKNSSKEFSSLSPVPLSFRRIPTIVVGDADEGEQALALLREISPVSFDEYYAEYSARYGFRIPTVRSNLTVSRALYPYLRGRIYSIDNEMIDPRDVEAFSSALSGKRLWLREEAEELFATFCTHSSPEAFNKGAFRTIGYTLLGECVFHRSYMTLARVLEEEYFSSPVLDTALVPSGIRHMQPFLLLLSEKRKKLEYFEIRRGVNVMPHEMERLYGITWEDIDAFFHRLSSLERDTYYNAHSLRRELEDEEVARKTGYDTFILSALMRQEDGAFSRYFRGGYVISRTVREITVEGMVRHIFPEAVADTGKAASALLEEYAIDADIRYIAERLPSPGSNS